MLVTSIALQRDSPSIAIWRSQGWVDIQTWDLGSLCGSHSVGSKILDSDATVTHKIWPMPAYIPYDKVDLKQWHSEATFDSNSDQHDADHRFELFGSQFEQSLTGVIEAPGVTLPPAARSRGKHKTPELRPQQCPLLKPSRPGEVAPSSDFLGRTVHKWFLQLRRMQSMHHALQANKQTWDAIIYRIEPWRSITTAKGFESAFPLWWLQQPLKLQGSPAEWPQQVPSLAMMKIIPHIGVWGFSRERLSEGFF